MRGEDERRREDGIKENEEGEGALVLGLGTGGEMQLRTRSVRGLLPGEDGLGLFLLSFSFSLL